MARPLTFVHTNPRAGVDSTRQHVLVNIGVRTPLSQRSERGSSVLVYLLWDWFDGGFFSGW